MIFNRKRLRRYHLKDSEGSIEGVARRRPVAGHYVVERPKWFGMNGSAVDETKLEGAAEIPREGVLYVQVIG